VTNFLAGLNDVDSFMDSMSSKDLLRLRLSQTESPKTIQQIGLSVCRAIGGPGGPFRPS
jgi:hypothetical protein